MPARYDEAYQVSPTAKAWISPTLAQALRTFYLKHGVRLTYAELLLEIERRYGTRIVQEVCIPHGLTEGACLVIAASVARDVSAIP